MCNDGFEDIMLIGGYRNDAGGQRVVKRYWLFDTENGALILPPDSDETNIQTQGEE